MAARRSCRSGLMGASCAAHPRGMDARTVFDPTDYYEGADTERVLALAPLGKMGRKLQELWHLAPERRPIDLYAALADVAR